MTPVYSILLSDLLGGSKEDAKKQAEEERKRRRLVALVTGSTDDKSERTELAHAGSVSEEYSSRGKNIPLEVVFDGLAEV